jgi:predicted dehydrogenase
MAWGVLGAADIALRKVIPGMLTADDVEIVAIASRDGAKAREAADRFGIRKSHGSYEALLADSAVEAVYIPLPNHLHVPWSIRALEAGKHVLCEKPIGLTAAEAEALIAARNRSGKQVLEAFMVRQHPQWLLARDIVRSGLLGTVRLVTATIGYYNRDPANVRNIADIGGGALYDVGCYAIVFGRFLWGAEPSRVAALIDRDPDMGTDRLTSGLVDFGGGRQLVFSVSTQLCRYQTVQAFGEEARLAVPVSLNAPPEDAMHVLVDRTGAFDGSGIETHELPPVDQYARQAELATAVFRGARAEFPIEDAIANMRVVDALYRAGESGRWETV